MSISSSGIEANRFLRTFKKGIIEIGQREDELSVFSVPTIT